MVKIGADVKIKVDDRAVLKAAIKTLPEVMYLMEGEAVRKCPVDTGRLRASIHVEKKSDYKYILVAGTDYAIFQEYGTIRMKAQPFMRPAKALGEAKKKEIFERNLKAETK